MDRYSEGSKIIDDSQEHVDIVEQLKLIKEQERQKNLSRIEALAALAVMGEVTVRPHLLSQKIAELSQ